MGYFNNDSVYDCPTIIPEDFIAWIRSDVLTQDRVLLYRKGGINGTCYACGDDVRSEWPIFSRFAQYAMRDCPSCGAHVTCYLDSGVHFKSLYVANVCLTEVKGDVVWFRFFHVVRERPGFVMLEHNLQKNEFARHAIHGKDCAKWVKEGCFGMGRSRYTYANWERKRNVHDVYGGIYEAYISADTQEALKSTSLRWARPWDYADYIRTALPSYHPDPVVYMQDFARYPVVEKLWNAGYKRLVAEKVIGLRKETKNTIRWQRQSLKEAIKFPMRFLREHEPEAWTMAMLERMRQCFNWGDVWDYNDADILRLYRSTLPERAFRYVLGHGSLRKVLRFWTEVLHERNLDLWTDHIKISIQMGRNLDDDCVFFPKNISTEHQRLVELQIAAERASESRALRESLRTELSVPFTGLDAMMKKYSYASDGLIIRPAQNAFELVEEGDSLHHCVSGYASRMEHHKTVILFIRRESEPDTSFFTLEFLSGAVNQCRTFRNESYENWPEIMAFVQKWLSAKKLVANKPKIA